jgi:plastocyanin
MIRRRAVSAGALTLSLAFVSSCKALGIVHPVSDDGSCGTPTANPCQQNLGTQVLTLVPASTVIRVGSGVGITATYGGMTLPNGLAIPSTVSDSSVINANAFAAYGLAVGTASVTATYNGSQATVTFGVEQDTTGISAQILAEVYAGGMTSWLPTSAKVRTGWLVQFRSTDNTNQKHDVVFDPVPGAPANLVSGVTALRTFTTAGSFPYHCSIHGEAGVVTVTP